MAEAQNYSSLERNIGYHFQNPELLARALTHRSFVYEDNNRRRKKGPKLSASHYERLEFLGDAVVDLVVGHLLIEKFPEAEEGDLSRLRASLVNVHHLAQLAKKLNLHLFLRLGKGEETTGGRDKPSILADSYEALCAAVYLDGGFGKAFEMIRKHLQETLRNLSLDLIEQDYKTKLQELVQAQGQKPPRYRLISESGPDHNKTFEIEVLISQKPIAQGSGKSKKEAEQNAAQRALEILKNPDKI